MMPIKRVTISTVKKLPCILNTSQISFSKTCLHDTYIYDNCISPLYICRTANFNMKFQNVFYDNMQWGRILNIPPFGNNSGQKKVPLCKQIFFLNKHAQVVPKYQEGGQSSFFKCWHPARDALFSYKSQFQFLSHNGTCLRVYILNKSSILLSPTLEVHSSQ